MNPNPDRVFLEHQTKLFNLTAKLKLGWGKRFNHVVNLNSKRDNSRESIDIVEINKEKNDEEHK